MKKQKFLLGLVVVFCVSLFTVGNVNAKAAYTKGDGDLLVDGIPTSLSQLAERMSSSGTASSPKGVQALLSKYACAGTAVLLIAPEEVQRINNTPGFTWPANWYPVDLDNDTFLDGIVIGFGYADWSKRNKVDPLTTVFQVGSLSKPVSAYGAMQMVGLNEQVITYVSNTKYYPWAIQANLGVDANKIEEVTFEQIILHRSGLNQTIAQGYKGWISDYAGDSNIYDQYVRGILIKRTMPTTSQVLNGDDNRLISFGKVMLTNDPDTTPRKDWVLDYPDQDIPNYSGGGYLVMQLAMENMLRSAGLYTNKSDNSLFGTYMDNMILLDVFGMTKSTYLYKNSLALATPYYNAYWNSKGAITLNNPITNKYIYAEKAVCGLYSTVDDMGRFVFRIMKNDEQSKILYVYPKSPDQYNQNYINDPNYYINDPNFYYNNCSQFFKHTGSNIGWRSLLSGATIKVADNSQQGWHPSNIGLVVLTNTGDDLLMWGGNGVMAEIFDAWEKTYNLEFAQPPK